MVFIEPAQLKIKEYNVKTEKWGDNKPIRIALIADTHAIWPWMTEKRLKKIVHKTNNLNPDLILMLGDYVATHPFGIQPIASKNLKVYEEFESKCGTYSVIGNHDLHGSVGWLEALRAKKLNVLENKSIKIKCKDYTFWLGGLEDLWWQNSDVEKTLSDIIDDEPIIIMTHNPDAFVNVPSKVAITVAGHTHAGQIKFPFIGAIKRVIPSKYGKRFIYGHIQEDGKDLIVSGGLGSTGIPARLLNPPEIVLVTLQNTSE